MKTWVIVTFMLCLAIPAAGAVIWDEGSNGDLSSDPAVPTRITFAQGSSNIKGTINGNMGPTLIDRDYITFTIPANFVLSHLNLIAFDPDDVGFTALNADSTSFIPSGATNGSFLAGIHFDAQDVGHDLMDLFVNRSVTVNALSQPQLGPGRYCWMIQQTGPILQNYEVEFVVEPQLATEPSTWGKVKALYR